MRMAFITMGSMVLLLAGAFVYAIFFKKPEVETGRWEELPCDIQAATMRQDVDIMRAGGWELDRIGDPIGNRIPPYEVYRCVFKRPAH